MPASYLTDDEVKALYANGLLEVLAPVRSNEEPEREPTRADILRRLHVIEV
jgi:hypothetical protein